MRIGILLIAIGVVAFLVSLDSFIVNVAIPTISGDLGVRRDIGVWVVTVFTMSSTLFIPMSGWLAQRYGVVRLFVVSSLLFALFSFLCGNAQTFTLLLTFRIFQGATVGILIPLSLDLIITTFPENKRGIAIGFWSFFVMVSPAMGPMVGGWLSDEHWRWMFFLNIPLTILSACTILILMWDQREKTKRVSFDYVGTFLIFTAIIACQAALNRGQIDDWFRSKMIISLLILSGCAFAFFLAWEFFQKNPFLDLAVFKRRNFSLAAFTIAIAMGVIFSSFILDSLWVQRVLGYTPAWAGLTLTPVGIFPLILYPLMGRVVGYLDRRIWLVISLLIYSVSFFMLSKVNLQTTFAHLAITRLFQGIGFAMLTVPLSLMAIEGVEEERLPFVVALFSFIRTLGVSLTVPLITTLWIHREAFYQTRFASKSFVENPAYQKLLHLMPSPNVAHLNQLVSHQASTLGIADIYYFFGWIFLALLFVVFIFKSSKHAR
ncbi:MAG: DHA2 family efflux MFS transporter permease subunit [Chlamydiales bacterium]